MQVFTDLKLQCVTIRSKTLGTVVSNKKETRILGNK